MPGSVSFLPLAFIIAGGVTSEAIFAYAAYWAFSIRRALVVRVYRNQALGIGLVAFAWIWIFLANLFFEVLSPNYTVLITAISVLAMLLFYFIDASVLAGRNSDPLLRNTLHWKQLRIFLWVTNIAAVFTSIALAAYFQLTTGGEPQFVLTWGGSLFIYIIMPSGVAGLSITAARSKDPLMRRNLEWFGGFIASLGIVDVSRIASPGVVDVTHITGSVVGTFVGLIIAGICLYKSAKSLVPLNKLSAAD